MHLIAIGMLRSNQTKKVTNQSRNIQRSKEVDFSKMISKKLEIKDKSLVNCPTNAYI